MLDLSSPPVGDEVRVTHRRTPKSQIAYCGAPAKQEQLTDDLGDVTCRPCWDAMRGGQR